MAYEVTATRRRPGRFEDLVGQDFVVATLQKSIQAGKIAPAYLFSGPRGCGKTSSARILARALNCETGAVATPCGTCASCQEIARGASLDVIEIDGASNTGVNDVRQIKDEVRFPPNSCRYKIYIIDEVHMLSTSAFNALLKTIEEPPPYVIFIFATTELHKVPATIKSRCQQFNFRLVPVETLKTALAEAAAETGIRADDEALYWIAREATGSVRDAYTLFDQIAAFSDGHVSFEKIRDKLGLAGFDRINAIVSACAARDAREALSLLDEVLDSGVAVEQFTVDLADFLRNLLLIKSGITRESLLGRASDRFSPETLAAWSAAQIERTLALVLQLYRDLRYSIEPRYELELTVSRLSWAGDYVSSAEMRASITRAQSLLRGSAPGDRAGTGGVKPEPRATGPFPDAGRDSGALTPVASRAVHDPAARETASALPAVTEEEETRSGSDGFVENPFAALKERINGRAKSPTEGFSPTLVPPASEAPMDVSRAAMPAPVPVPVATAIPAPTQSPARAPAGAALGPDELKEAVVTFFQSSKNMLATGLSQATDWGIGDDTLRLVVEKPFTRTFLEQDRATIGSAVSHILGRPVGVEVILKAAQETVESADGGVPPTVEMVRSMFRGTIVEGA